MIEVKNLVKCYGAHQALKGIDFLVEDGQIVGLLGPNGAGKSTTMNILTGYLCPTSGSVSIGGHDIMEQPVKAKRLMGYLPELPPLYEDMTVEEYLDFVCSLKGMKKKQEKKKEIARVEEEVKITEVKGKLIKNLSKGYKQRVGLAQALLGNPPLLILDEPTVGLDPNQIVEIRALIKDLAGEHTIILSSHILSEVNAICDYVLIIDKGTVVAEDTPEHLSEHFADRNRVLLSVKGERETVEEALAESKWILSYKITGEAEGIVDATAEGQAGVDIRDSLFFEFAGKKLPIVKMETETLSLEEVFRKLTGPEAAEPVGVRHSVVPAESVETEKERTREEEQNESDL